MFHFKNKTIEIDGQDFNLRELSVKQQKELFEAFKEDNDSTLLQARYVKAGCHECKEMELDEILDAPASVIKTLSEAVAELSGLTSDEDDEKN